MSQKTKNLIVNGAKVGEFEASDDYQVEKKRMEALLKSKGLWQETSKEQAMFNHAYAFAHTASKLYKTIQTDRSQLNKAAVPFVVNITFALEIYLKTLAQINGIKLKGHKLKKLFDQLPDHYQERIRADYPKYAKKYHVDPQFEVEKLLASINKAYVTWRYTYEIEPSEIFYLPATIALGATLFNFTYELLNQ